MFFSGLSLVSLSLFSTTLAVSSQLSFEDFVVQYDKTYETRAEYELRKSTYNYNLHRLEMLQKQHPELEFAMNAFGDLTMQEFHGSTKGLQTSLLRRTKQCETYEYKESWVPSSWDWREQGAVTAVKNQGQCGSCWSFSASGAMEGAWAISKGQLLNVSEQQLMDCSTKYINFGCNGGDMDHAFEYAIDNGMCLDSDVPYVAEDGSCSDEVKECEKVATFSKCVDIPSEDELSLEEAVHFTPVSVAIEADTTVFQFYKGGVLTSDKCGTSLDHGVLVVGYGVDDEDQAYWIVKNSWGEEWGENGYIRIAKSSVQGEAGVCGIALQPSFIEV